jgi:hypothetical protein
MMRFHTCKNTHIYKQKVAPYISSMSHNNGKVANLREKSISKFENFLPNDNEGDVGGLNYTLCLMKPLISMPLYF